ncbi:MAG: PAS domain-containing protein, partial [Flavobacteriaceae bacterium]|nr:PAS domain-containing protein [Flavobacteriaceae bacterium]
MPSPDSLYQEVFSSNENFKNSIVEKHINKYREIDKIYPSNQSFFIIINTAKMKYDFVSSNFKNIVGYSIEDLKNKGPNFFMSLFHPDDLKLWLHEIKDFMDLTITDFSLEDRKKLLYTYNFRLKNIKNNYINL